MKVVAIGSRGFPGVQGGVETHCEKLYTHLAELGCSITVFTRRPYVDPDIHTYKGVSLIALHCPHNKYLEAIVHTFKSVIKARTINPDVLHLHAVGPSLFAPLASMLGMKVVITNHGPDYMRKKWSLPAKLFLKFCERVGIIFADRIIAIARNISDEIKENYGRDSIIIPNGVDIPIPPDTDEYLTKYGLHTCKYILSIGRLVPEKGFHDLIEAYNTGHFRDWKLVIVGAADHEDDYSLGLNNASKKNNNIIMTGTLTGQALAEIYSHAGLFVLASYYEGMPIALLEAMSYGLSCVASDIPANKNIELGEDRYFISGDKLSLEKKLSELIGRPWGEAERRRQIQSVAEKYNWRKIAERTLTVYKDVIL